MLRQFKELIDDQPVRLDNVNNRTANGKLLSW